MDKGLLTHDGEWAQTLLPRVNGSDTNPALSTFTPGPETFSLSIDPESGDWTLNNTTPDSCGASNDGCQLGHHLRTWPAEDRDGFQVGDSWIVVMDYSGINYDFNDNVYLVENITPANPVDTTAPTAPSELSASVEGEDVQVTWTGVDDEDLAGYVVQRQPDGTSDWTDVGEAGGHNIPCGHIATRRHRCHVSGSCRGHVGEPVHTIEHRHGDHPRPESGLHPDQQRWW